MVFILLSNKSIDLSHAAKSSATAVTLMEKTNFSNVSLNNCRPIESMTCAWWKRLVTVHTAELVERPYHRCPPTSQLGTAVRSRRPRGTRSIDASRVWTTSEAAAAERNSGRHEHGNRTWLVWLREQAHKDADRRLACINFINHDSSR